MASSRKGHFTVCSVSSQPNTEVGTLDFYLDFVIAAIKKNDPLRIRLRAIKHLIHSVSSSSISKSSQPSHFFGPLKHGLFRLRLHWTSTPWASLRFLCSEAAWSLDPVSIGELAFKNGKHLVTTSYNNPSIQALEQAAKEAGVTILNEVGFDPGIDHLYAVKKIGEVHSKGGKVSSRHSGTRGRHIWPRPRSLNSTRTAEAYRPRNKQTILYDTTSPGPHAVRFRLRTIRPSSWRMARLSRFQVETLCATLIRTMSSMAILRRQPALPQDPTRTRMAWHWAKAVAQTGNHVGADLAASCQEREHFWGVSRVFYSLWFHI